MLPKKYRIPKNGVIHVAREGKRFSYPHFTLTIARNSENVSRFAVRIGVAIHKRAVVRNHMKRLYHESMADILPTLPHPVDILCSIKHAQITETLDHITTNLSQALEKII